MSNLEALVNDLEQLLPQEFHRKMLLAALQSLEDDKNPIALNSFAAAFRELTRHVFTTLAPRARIKDCPWFEPDSSSKTGITRRHAITYLVQGGLSDAYVTKSLGIDVESERHELLRLIDDLSKFTHIEENTFGTDPATARQFASDALEKFLRVLSLAAECRRRLNDELEEHVSEEVIRNAVTETVASIDVIASHYFLDEVYVDEVQLKSLDARTIVFRVSGSLGVEHQIGSASDARNGDAVNWDASYPFTCEVKADIEAPEKLDVVESSLQVDTSSWWDDCSDSEDAKAT